MRSPFQFGRVEEDDPNAWKLKGACRARHRDGSLVHNPEIFFPENRAERYQRPGKKICAHCPVIEQCRAHAMVFDEFGIWGGLSEYDRRHLKKQDRQKFLAAAGRLRAG
jgi:WhiB family redox-sensing transcriptional regulator